MPSASTLIQAFSLLAFFHSVLADDFQTADGHQYKNVTVSRIEPDGIVTISQTGIVKLYFTELPNEVRSRYGYDPTKAAAYAASQAEAARLANAQAAASVAKQMQLNAVAAQKQAEESQMDAALAKIRASALELRVTDVDSIADEGIVMIGMNASDTKGRSVFSAERFLLVGMDPTDLTDHAQLVGHQTIYRAGVFKSGGSTIARYATSPELAYKLIQADQKQK